jgi:hypothetical protein
MKPLTWIATVLGFLVVALWWRQGDLRDEITQMRVEIAEARPTPVASHSPKTAASTPFPAETPREARSRIGMPVAEAGDLSAAERVADLERVVNAQADLIEKLLGRFDEIDAQRQKASARAWGPEQAAGAPDTMNAGDYRTAWAPAGADAGVEWIEASFETPAEAAQVIVRQTSNPGTITKVVAVLESGTEIPIWSGQDPSKGQALADTPFAFPAGITAGRVRVYLDTSKMPGWEEIDAIQLVGRDGSRQWAKSVTASSTYAGGNVSRLGRLEIGDTFLGGVPPLQSAQQLDGLLLERF